MSTKSTLFSTACCHIYKDKKYQHTDSPCDGDEDVLVIDAQYQSVDYESREDQSSIVVEWESDFAEMIRVLLSLANHDALDEHLRKYHEKNK